uniref:Translation initiation factor IF-2, chloroplastic n=1 Tax=Vertebrata thuyoides TaxID=2006970 RepID=A0A1Z1MBB7_9FLOR|nr:translation initiation factor 2 [Vertebrata thuyoides]ARW63115.1 translation initiation factor 2 [Vertebrata thuyoides]
MVSMDYKQYNLCRNSCCKINIISFLSNLEYYDDILFLTHPKILVVNNINNKFAVDVKNIITVDGDKTKNTNSMKFEKKYRSTANIDDKDSIKSKKNKSKLGKVKDRNDNNEVKKFTKKTDDLLITEVESLHTLKIRKASLKNKKNRSLSTGIVNDKLAKTIDQNFTHSSESSKTLFIDNPLSIKDFALKINISEAEIITYLFINKGISATINEILDLNMCNDLAEYYGFKLLKSKSDYFSSSFTLSKYNSSSKVIKRSPLITILGHVDHGKTTLLDSILQTNLVDKEVGGITQSISAYEVFYQYSELNLKLVFLDTPGHESFKLTRLRGVEVTDIVLLVIAIDDGLKPQTIESINYVKKMNLQCIVVLTKSDKSINNLQKIKEDLASHDLLCYDWGGNVDYIQVSAINGYNIDKLLASICSLAQSQNLLANPKEQASGVIIDAFLDKQKGPVAILVIQNGTLKMGDMIVSENLLGRVKNIINCSSCSLEEAGPSSIVKVLCFSSVPKSGSAFISFNNEKEAKKYCGSYVETQQKNLSLSVLNKRISLTNVSKHKELKLIIKADTQGSLEAIIDVLSNISQEKVQVNIIAASFGNITNNDIHLSMTTKSSLLAFSVDALPQINILIKKYKINFNIFYIIYDLLDYVTNLMLDLVEPEYSMTLTGNVSIKTIFKMNKGFVAGCVVTNGTINSKSYIYVYRKNVIVYKGYITSLKYMKTDVDEVLFPSECGLMSDFQDWQQSDLIEAYDTVIKEKEL